MDNTWGILESLLNDHEGFTNVWSIASPPEPDVLKSYMETEISAATDGLRFRNFDLWVY